MAAARGYLHPAVRLDQFDGLAHLHPACERCTLWVDVAYRVAFFEALAQAPYVTASRYPLRTWNA